MKYEEIYDGDYIVRLMIRVYMDSKKMDRPSLSSEERDSSLSSIIQGGLSEIEPIRAREIRNRIVSVAIQPISQHSNHVGLS